MRSALATAGLACLLNALAACGSQAFESGPSADMACSQIAAARCDRTAACSPVAVQVRFGTDSDCRLEQKAACLNVLAASFTSATPATIIACANVLPSVDCTDYNENFLPTQCQAQVGKLADGAVCAFNAQCRSQFCGIDKTTNCGVCQALPMLGDPCAHLTTCGPGLVCVNKGTVCASEATRPGDTCDADVPCGVGFSCVGSRPATATAAAIEGTCQPAVETMGAACDPKRKASAGCDASKGLACDPTSMTCTAVALADAGQACDNNLTLCRSAAACVIAAGTTSGTCVAAAADGAACDTAGGPSCSTLSRCIVTGSGTAGTCELPADTCASRVPSP